MIDALMTGRLATQAKVGTASNGNEYVTARVMTQAGAEERLSISLIAFDEAVVTALLALDVGDTVALAGEFTPKAWSDREGTARPGGDMKVHAVLTPYHVQRKRRAAQGGEG